jgi:hypothetical protein
VNQIAFLDVILHLFAEKFELSQQTLLVIGDVYSGVVVGLQ